MAHTNYLVYFDKEDLDPAAGSQALEAVFGSENVYRLNDSTTFAIKVPEEETFSNVQNRVGFTERADKAPVPRGIIVAMLPGYRNGWYSRQFWDFLTQDWTPQGSGSNNE